MHFTDNTLIEGEHTESNCVGNICGPVGCSKQKCARIGWEAHCFDRKYGNQNIKQ